MREFLSNNLANIIVTAILITAIIFAIIKIKKSKGTGGCNGNCDCCNNACSKTPTKKD